MCIHGGHGGEGIYIKKRGQEGGLGQGGRGGEGRRVRVADMLIVRDKHFSAVVILGEAVTSLAC